MGYAGYKAAKLPPPLPSAVQSALWAVPSQESLEIIEKLTKNVAVNPTGSKCLSVFYSYSRLHSGLMNQSYSKSHSCLDWFLLPTAEEKFKRIRLTNSKIKAALVDVPGE